MSVRKTHNPKSRQKPAAPTCATCRYVMCEQPDADFGFCFRNPPTALMKIDGTIQSTRPTVKLDWWCAEWRART